MSGVRFRANPGPETSTAQPAFVWSDREPRLRDLASVLSELSPIEPQVTRPHHRHDPALVEQLGKRDQLTLPDQQPAGKVLSEFGQGRDPIDILWGQRFHLDRACCRTMDCHVTELALIEKF